MMKKEYLCPRSLDFEPALQHGSALTVTCAVYVFDRARTIIVTAHRRLCDASVGEICRSACTGGIHSCKDVIECVPARVLWLGRGFWGCLLRLD